MNISIFEQYSVVQMLMTLIHLQGHGRVWKGGGGGGEVYFLNVGLLFKKVVEEMEITFLECTKTSLN